MSYTLIDLQGLVLAAVLCGPLLILPGLTIGRLAGVIDLKSGPALAPALAMALIIGYGVLPVFDSLAGRIIGLWPTLAMHALLAIPAMVALPQAGAGLPPRGLLAGLFVWFCILAIAWVDFDWQGNLHQSLLIKDMVKHAATVRAMVVSGQTPPSDVFFLREAAAGYYYYYYVLSALVEVAGGGLIDSRAAMGGQVFWTGLALLSLVLVLNNKIHDAPQDQRMSAQAPVAALLLGVTGMEILTIALIGALAGVWYVQLSWWDVGFGGLLHATLWVPHHLAAVIATWGGFLLLTCLRDGANPRKLLTCARIAAAGACFASALGLSLWVTFGAVIIAASWSGLLAYERRWTDIAALIAAGAVALILSVPQLNDMLANRAYEGFPIGLSIRKWPLDAVLGLTGTSLQFARLLWLPLNIVIGFGFMFFGALVFWRRRNGRRSLRGDVGRLLVISALTGLIVSSFVKSTIVNNDLGWRIMLFAQIPMFVWTLSVVGPLWRLVRRTGLRGPRVPGLAQAFVLALLLGATGTVYELTAMRAGEVLGLKPDLRDPGVQSLEWQARSAYEWANHNRSPLSVIQHNPETRYMLGFGLYGRLPISVAHKNLGSLFGASRADVEARISDISPVFNTILPAGEAKERLSKNHVDLVIVTDADAVWLQPDSWVWRTETEFASARVRVLAVEKLTP